MERELDGTVRLLSVGPGVSDEPPTTQYTATSAPNACNDGAYSYSTHEGDVHHWRYNASTTDVSLDNSEALGALRRANFNITHGYTNCSSFGNSTYGAQGQYDGNTSRRANMSGESCGSRDQHNVHDFGRLDGRPSGNDTLGKACYWYNPINGDVLEGDVRYDNGNYWAVLPGCAGQQYDLTSVATHEWGHIFGLRHVSESSHGNLTMSTLINGQCQARERTLGKGDWLGLQFAYGGANP